MSGVLGGSRDVVVGVAASFVVPDVVVVVVGGGGCGGGGVVGIAASVVHLCVSDLVVAGGGRILLLAFVVVRIGKHRRGRLSLAGCMQQNQSSVLTQASCSGAKASLAAVVETPPGVFWHSRCFVVRLCL